MRKKSLYLQQLVMELSNSAAAQSLIRAFLKKLLTGFSKVIGQKVDKKFEMGALFVRTEVEHTYKRKILLFMGPKPWLCKIY